MKRNKFWYWQMLMVVLTWLLAMLSLFKILNVTIFAIITMLLSLVFGYLSKKEGKKENERKK